MQSQWPSGRATWIQTIATLAVLSGSSAFAMPLMDPFLYVHDSRGNLGRINVDSGDVEVIDRMSEVLFDIAFSPNGQTLYGVSPNGLYSVDPETADLTFIGNDGFGGTTMNALVFDSNGSLFAAGAGSNALYRIDINSGAATSVGDMGISSAGDLAFDRSGQLYLSGRDDALYRVNKSSGAASEVGAFGVPDVLGLARGDNGTMFAYSGTDIFTVDLQSGVATQFLDYTGQGLSQAYGGSFRLEAVPEPASLSLFVGLLAALVFRRQP